MRCIICGAPALPKESHCLPCRQMNDHLVYLFIEKPDRLLPYLEAKYFLIRAYKEYNGERTKDCPGEQPTKV